MAIARQNLQNGRTLALDMEGGHSREHKGPFPPAKSLRTVNYG